MQSVKGTLTHMEGVSLACVTFVFQIFNATLPYLSGVVGNAAWMAQLLGSLLAFPLLALYLALLRRFEGKNLLEIISEVYGPVVSKVVLAVVFVYFVVLASTNLDEILSLIRTHSYGELHPLLLGMLLMLVVCISARYSVKGLGATVSLFLPVLMGLIVLVLCITAPQYDIHYLTPLFGWGPAAIGSQGFLLLSNYEGLLVVTVFLGEYGGTKEFAKSIRRAILIASLFIVTATLCYNMTFPYNSIFQSQSGLLNMTQSVYINRFFQRFEAAFSAGFSTIVLLVLCVKFMGAKKTYCHLFSIRDNNANAVVLPLAALVIGAAQYQSSLKLYENTLREFLHEYGWIMTVGLVLVTYLVSLARKRGARGSAGGWKRALAMVVLPCLLAGLFSGCGGYHEPDEEIYPVIMGYDRGESDKYKITFRLMLGEEAEGTPDIDSSYGLDENGDPPPEIFVVEAPSALVALDYVSSIVPKRFSLMHINMMIVSEELAMEGLGDLLSPIIRHKDTKNTMALLVTRGTAYDTILQPTGKLDASLPIYIELIQEGRKGITNYTRTNIKDIYNDMSRSYGDGMVMYMGFAGLEEDVSSGFLHPGEEGVEAVVEGEEGSEEAPSDDSGGQEDGGDGGGQKESSPGDDEVSTTGETPLSNPFNEERSARKQEEEPTHHDPQHQGEEEEDNAAADFSDELSKHIPQGFIPGQLPIESSSKTEIAGMAVLRGAQMVGYINSRENAIYMMLTGQYRNGYYAITDPYDTGNYIIYTVDTRQRPRVSVELGEDGKPDIHMDIYLAGRIAVAQNEDVYYSDSKHREVLIDYTTEIMEKEARLLIDKLQTEFEADSLRLGQYVARQFRTIGSWEEYNWPEQYLNADIGVTIHFTL